MPEQQKPILKAAETIVKNYDLMAEWHLPLEKKLFLKRTDEKKICRFCGLQSPDVLFRKIAHAIPESIGNKTLFSEYECDSCNAFFGNSIENDFGNWSLPIRTVLRIRGKSGAPTLRESSQGGWRIGNKKDQLEISSYENDAIFDIDEENEQVKLKLRRDPYTPMGVLKAFFKMALTLLPEKEIPYFIDALAWIKSPHVKCQMAEKVPVLYSFIPGPMPNDKIGLRLHRRKDDTIEQPYMFFVLLYGNEMYQVFIPCEKDRILDGKTGQLFFYPTPADLQKNWPYGGTIRKPLYFSGTGIIKNEFIPMTMNYEIMRKS